MQVDLASTQGGKIPIDPETLLYFIRTSSDEKFQSDTKAMKKLNNSGLRPNQIISSISRHFSLLHRISIDIRNIETALNNTYPPLFGQRRTAVIQQSKIWNTPKLERALAIISEVEQKSRLSSKVTLLTLLERSLLRIGALVKAIH